MKLPQLPLAQLVYQGEITTTPDCTGLPVDTYSIYNYGIGNTILISKTDITKAFELSSNIFYTVRQTCKA